jgi:osmotically-inducible protein OsmY
MKQHALLRTTAAVAAGAGAEYFLDPDRGRTRRARFLDQSRHWVRRSSHIAGRRVRFVHNRARGRMYQARHEPTPPIDDYELVQKIRSEVLGRRAFRPLHLTIDAVDGVVHLRGTVPDPLEAATVTAAVADVDGVAKVESFLHSPSEPAPNKVDALRA